MQMPPLPASRARMASGTFRGWSQTASAEECEKITGASAVSSASLIVVGRDVGQVDQHAEPLHLPDDLAAERGQAPGGRLVGRRVGPGQVQVVGQRQVPDAEQVQGPQHAQRVRDRMTALGPEQGCDPAAGHDPLHVGSGERQLERVRIAGGKLPDQVDLLKRRGHRGLALQVGRHVHRPELGADPARGQPGQVGVGELHRRREVGGGRIECAGHAQRPGQVIVPVDHGKAVQQRPSCPGLCRHVPRVGRAR